MKILDGWLPLGAELQKVWQKLVKALTTSSELRVWQTFDCCGHPCWHAYDPATGRSACFGSESEIRVWVEQRYYTS